MTPTHTHTETLEGMINISGQESDCTISIEGETFEENIFPMSTEGVHTRFTIKNVNTRALIGTFFINQKMPKEDLENQCKLLSKDINKTINALL